REQLLQRLDRLDAAETRGIARGPIDVEAVHGMATAKRERERAADEPEARDADAHRYARTRSGVRRPIAPATAVTPVMSAAKFSKVRDSNPSDRAWSGLGCTSMSSPSAPAATAASATGATRYHFPVPWDGSAITGRCVRRFRSGTALTSNVLRVYFSKVRMPRSHRMTLRLPRASTYSAESRSSSTVADMPRFRSTGFGCSPTASSSE